MSKKNASPVGDEGHSGVEIKIPLNWDKANFDDLGPPQYFTHFILQKNPSGDMIFILGYMEPPLVWGDPEQQIKMIQEKFEKRGVTPIPVAKIACTGRTAHELLGILKAQLESGNSEVEE